MRTEATTSVTSVACHSSLERATVVLRGCSESVLGTNHAYCILHMRVRALKNGGSNKVSS